MGRPVIVTMKVFESEIRAGARQQELLARVRGLAGAQGAEIRREFLTNPKTECAAIARENAGLGLELYYSAPAVLFVRDRLDIDTLRACAEEAEAAGASRIKFSAGEWNPGRLEEKAEDLRAAVAMLQAHGLHLTIENDQTQSGGRIAAVEAVLALCRRNGLPVGHTFDTGNWLYTGEDPFAAARALAPYADYIHLKDVRTAAGVLETVFPGKGALDWRGLLDLLPDGVPIGLEFPADSLPDLESLVRAL